MARCSSFKKNTKKQNNIMILYKNLNLAYFLEQTIQAAANPWSGQVRWMKHGPIDWGPDFGIQGELFEGVRAKKCTVIQSVVLWLNTKTTAFYLTWRTGDTFLFFIHSWKWQRHSNQCWSELLCRIMYLLLMWVCWRSMYMFTRHCSIAFTDPWHTE